MASGATVQEKAVEKEKGPENNLWTDVGSAAGRTILGSVGKEEEDSRED